MAARKIYTEGQASMQERYPLNIAQDLFDSWQMMKRYGDAALIAKEKGISRPIVDRALNYGHVTKHGVTMKINNYFNARIALEKAEKDIGKKFIESLKK
jgi:DNA-binding phage protein